MKRLLGLMLCLVALPAAAIDGTQILQKVDRNLEPESYESYRQLTDIQPDGSKKVSVLYTMKKGRDRLAVKWADDSRDAVVTATPAPSAFQTRNIAPPSKPMLLPATS